jgi:ribonuclease HI
MFILFDLDIHMTVDQENIVDKLFKEIPFSKKTRIGKDIKKIYLKNILTKITTDEIKASDNVVNFVESIIGGFEFDNKTQEEITKNSLLAEFSKSKYNKIINKLDSSINFNFRFKTAVKNKNLKIIYSDGSINTSTNVGGYGVCELINESDKNKEAYDFITEKTWDYTTYSGNTGDKKGTNNIAELMGISKALDIINRTDKDVSVIISDSEYSVKAMREWYHNWKKNGWKTHSGSSIKNKELIQEISTKKENDRIVLFCWTKAHVNTFFNEKCDMLAKSEVGV